MKVRGVLIFGIASLVAASTAYSDPLTDRVMNSIETRFKKSSLKKKYSQSASAFNVADHGYVADPKLAKIMTLMNGSALIQALRDGEIKNQYQVGYSGGGGYAPDERLLIEEDLSGLNIQKMKLTEKVQNTLLPKYGMIEFPDFASDSKMQDLFGDEIRMTEELDSYGEIAVYFKESVKKRTSFVPMDSGGLDHSKIGDLVQSLREKQVILDGNLLDAGNFFEAQIWGKLRIQDIDYVVVPTELFFDDSADVKAIERALRGARIPVFRPKKDLTDAEEIMSRMRVRFRNKKVQLLPKAKRAKCGRALKSKS